MYDVLLRKGIGWPLIELDVGPAFFVRKHAVPEKLE
jgi:hypothetical protein